MLLHLTTLHSASVKSILDCQYSHHYYKSKSHSSNKEYLQRSRKKKGCKVHINIVEFNLYPEYSIKQSISSGISQNQIRKIREEGLSELQNSFESGKAPMITEKYFVSLPTEEAHHKCHPTKGIMGFSLPLSLFLPPLLSLCLSVAKQPQRKRKQER